MRANRQRWQSFNTRSTRPPVADAAAAAAADDACTAATNNANDNPIPAVNEQAAEQPLIPPAPVPPSGPAVPLCEVGDDIIYFGNANVQGTILAVDGGVDAGYRPLYDIQLDGGDRLAVSWQEVVKKPADFGTRIRYQVGPAQSNWEELAMAHVRSSHEELVKEIIAAHGDDDDGDKDDDVAESAERTNDDPLPGVDLSGIPAILRSAIAEEADRVRKWCKGSGSGNQHTAGRSIATWPYSSFDVVWNDPMLLVDPKIRDFLLPTFGRCQFFLPSYTLRHQLDDGKMPCKWHGNSTDCVGQDAVYNPQGPRLRHDEDGGITYVFSSRHYCKCRRRENRDRPEGSEKIPYYFTGM